MTQLEIWTEIPTAPPARRGRNSTRGERGERSPRRVSIECSGCTNRLYFWPHNKPAKGTPVYCRRCQSDKQHVKPNTRIRDYSPFVYFPNFPEFVSLLGADGFPLGY